MTKVIRQSEETQKAAKALKERFNIGRKKDSEVFYIFTSEDAAVFNQAHRIIEDKQTATGVTGWNRFKSMMHLLVEGSDLEKIVLTDTSGLVNKSSMVLEDSLHESLTGQARRTGLELSDYIRGVIYTKSKEIVDAHKQKFEDERKERYDNRIEPVSVPIDKSIRDKYLKQHGSLGLNELNELIKADCLEFLKNKK